MKSQAIVKGNIGRGRVYDGEWQLMADPETEPDFYKHVTEPMPIRFLGESWEKGPWIIPNKVPPGAKADPHSHNYDTIYYVIKGSLTFHDGTGWYEEGDLRWVRAGTEYGPEEAGPQGCIFLLISMGPIEVAWVGDEAFEVKS